ncbi:MAG: GNAT family N-acetyltransferase, partial [Candidatus Hydrogenedentota bacterium]
IIKLSNNGCKTVDQLVPIWKDVRAVASNLIETSEPNFLTSIESVERQLDRKEMYPRIYERLKIRLLAAIEILEYKPAYKHYFRSLNYEWLRRHFRVEQADECVLSDPTGQIINKGGTVLFAKLQNIVVGTAALVRHDSGIFELAKMAVAESARRRLVGTKLTLEIIERAKAAGARYLYLETHPKLKPAQLLYENLGFERIDENLIPPAFGRRRIVMKMDL